MLRAVGAFSVYGIMGQKHGRVEVQIGICQAEEDADKLDLLNEVSVIG